MLPGRLVTPLPGIERRLFQTKNRPLKRLSAEGRVCPFRNQSAGQLLSAQWQSVSSKNEPNLL